MTHLGFRRNTLELAVIMLVSVKRYLSPVSCTELPTSKQAIKLLPNSNKPSISHQIGTNLQNAIKFRHAIRMPSNTHLSTIALNFALLWVHVRFLHSSSDRIHSFTFRWGFSPDILLIQKEDTSCKSKATMSSFCTKHFGSQKPQAWSWRTDSSFDSWSYS